MGFLKDKAMSFMEKRKAKKDFYNSVLEEERMKARDQAAVREATRLREKAKAKAQFESLPRTERAKARIQRGTNFLKQVGGAVNTVNSKLNAAGKRFEQKATQFGGQNQTFGQQVPAYLQEKKPKKKGGKRITITVRE